MDSGATITIGGLTMIHTGKQTSDGQFSTCFVAIMLFMWIYDYLAKNDETTWRTKEVDGLYPQIT